MAITADISGTSFMLYLTGAEGSMLFPIYFWVVVGNGVRFGSRYLFFSMILALIGFQWVLTVSPFWHQFPDLGNGLSLAIVILPLFYFIIMHRLHKKNYLLIEQVKSRTYEALHDPLTTLANRAFLLAQMEDLAKKERAYFLFFIDFDGFKNVNDVHGHDVGDYVLKEGAARIESTLKRFEGFAARLGGDEFAVIVELKNKNEVKRLATKLIKKISLPYKKYSSRISASIGITHYSPENPREIEDLLKEADKAMYQIKSEGKHGYRCYQDLEH
ncbi:diguanylate cyclase domain-containing protein [Sulfurimonas sp.]